MLITTLSQVIVAKLIWDSKDLTSLKAVPIQNAPVTKKDIEDFQKVMDNLKVAGKVSESRASPNWLMVSGDFSFVDFLRVVEVMNYSRVSMEKTFEGYTIESML
jgi:hypothetical protein